MLPKKVSRKETKTGLKFSGEVIKTVQPQIGDSPALLALYCFADARNDDWI
jgi:hypothetical protein